MLKKIPIDQVRLGMHLHELCGPWLDHPFWKKKFVISDPRDLAKLRHSSVTECWIDPAKGLDVEAAAPAPTPAVGVAAAAPRSAATPASAPAAAPAPIPPAAPAARVAIEEEAARAAALCQRSKQAVMSMYRDARMGRALDTGNCMPLVEDIAGSVARNAGALISLARLKTHDDYSYMHSVAVCALMVALARRLGHDEQQTREAGMAGLLHDLGKAVIPLEVLNKPGRLTDAEYALVKTHSRRGHDLLREGKVAGAVTLDVCLHHHERPDGAGYPEGIGGAALSLHARMGAVCDVYDAITSERPYKAGWDPAESIARMAEWTKAGQFDPAVYRAFVEILGIYPVGSLVRLQSGRLAVVIEQNAGALLSPRVKEFYSTRSQLPVPARVVDLARHGCGDRIVARESNERWKFAHLAEFVPGQAELRAPTAAAVAAPARV